MIRTVWLKLLNLLRVLKHKLFNSNPYWFNLQLAPEDKFVTPDFGLGQFFFTKETADLLVKELDGFRNPCCLCTPRLGQAWMEQGREVRVLDIDKRFKFLPGYRYFDLLKPTSFEEQFDLIIMDPYFFSPDKLVVAIDCLSKSQYQQKLLLVYKTTEEQKLLDAFAKYDLKRTEHHPSHTMVTEEGRKEFAFYANFDLFAGLNGKS